MDIVDALDRLVSDQDGSADDNLTSVLIECYNNNIPVYVQMKRTNGELSFNTNEASTQHFVNVSFSEPSSMDLVREMSFQDFCSSVFNNDGLDGFIMNSTKNKLIYFDRAYLLKALLHHDYPSQQNTVNCESKTWGDGIPTYSEDDVLSKSDLLNYAMGIVAAHELAKKDHEIISGSDNLEAIPNFISDRLGMIYFTIVDVTIFPEMPVLSDERREKALTIAKKFGAKLLYAPVTFASYDEARREARLALKGDGFIPIFDGCQKLN